MTLESKEESLASLEQKAIMKLQDVPEFDMDAINAFLAWGGQDPAKFKRIISETNLVALYKEIKGG